MRRDYETLDAIVVVGCLAIVAAMIGGFFLIDLKESITPVLSSIATAILGIPITYGAFRWGNSVGASKATGALGQLAGAGPQPPNSPDIDGAQP